jgi:tetratricopeptide (TPR) repeat protein
MKCPVKGLPVYWSREIARLIVVLCLSTGVVHAAEQADDLLARTIAQAADLALKGQVDAAIGIYDRLLAVPGIPPRVAARFHQLKGDAYVSARRGREAIDSYKRALDTLGLPVAMTAEILSGAAAAHRFEGNFDEALRLVREAMTRVGRANVLPADRRMMLRAYRVQECVTLSDADRFDEARRACEKLIGPTRELERARPSDAVLVYNALGVMCEVEGRYQEGKRHFQAVARVAKSLFPELRVQHIARAHLNTGIIENRLGNYDDARRELEEALRLRESFLPGQHPDVAKALDELAVNAIYRADPLTAVSYASRALLARRKWFAGRRTTALADSLNTTGGIFYELGKYEVAMTHFEEALEIFKDTGQEGDLRALQLHHSLAVCLATLGRLDEARPHLEVAWRGRSRLQRDTRLGLAGLASLRADLAWASGNSDQAVLDYVAAGPLWSEGLASALAASGQEEQRFGLVDRALGAQSRMLSFAATRTPPDRALVEAIAESILQTKGRTLDATVSLRAILRRRLTLADAQRLDAADTALRRVSPRDGESALATARQAQAALILELATKYNVHALKGAGLTAVLDALRRNHATLVEFIRFQRQGPFTRDRRPEYAAVVLRPDGAPVVRYLGDATAIDAAAEAWLWDIDSGVDDAGTGREIDRLVWAKIAADLPAEGLLHVAPDGALATLPFSAIPNRAVAQTGPHTSRLIDRYVINVLTSGRDLVGASPPARRASLLMIAAPGYVTSGPAPPRSFPPIEPPSIGRFFSPGSTRVWRGVQASKTHLLGLSDAPDALHFATHGIYRPLLDADTAAPARAGFASYRTMLASTGIALSGAYSPDRIRTEGVLSAFDLSLMRLAGVQLVFVAACDSGRGAHTSGYGLMGFLRAVRLAGAEGAVLSVVMTPDASSTALEQAFYREWTQGAGSAAALRRAQQQIKEDPRYWRPRFWAGYVASGGYQP